LPYLEAVLKEVLRCAPLVASLTLSQEYRFVPPVPALLKQVAKDDFIPLSAPIQLTNGEFIDHMHVSKGTELDIAPAPLNFRKANFGEDADNFNPESVIARPLFVGLTCRSRWLTGKIKTPLMTLGGGVRLCVGHRFAMAEMAVRSSRLCTAAHTLRRRRYSTS
jgi:cytochrome P450